MSVLTVRFHSLALGKKTSFNVIHPDVGEGPFPVLMQLHGYSDDSFSWLYNSNIVRHVANLPLIVVLPDGGTSRYVNMSRHERFGKQNYEDLLVNDIPAEVARMFHVRPGPWAIGGLSMGGQGALRLGMKYSDRFASIWGHSSGLLQPDPDWLAMLDDPEDASCFVQADRLQARVEAGGVLPAIAFDCGVDDFVIDGNRALHEHMDQIGLMHTYLEYPGEHTWDYWDEHLPQALAQHAEVLAIKPLSSEPVVPTTNSRSAEPAAKAMNEAPYIGVDGCPGGWVAVLWWPGSSIVEPRFVARLADLIEQFPDATIGVDMPIGLSANGARSCDVEVRRFLGPTRASSVFSPPIPAALSATTYAEARDLSRQFHPLGKSLSAQSFALFPKLREVRKTVTPELQDRVFEVHPEVSFAALAGFPLVVGKRQADGYEQRRMLLESAMDVTIPDRATVGQIAPPASADDVLDAMIGAWSARRFAEGMALRFPAVEERDELGLRMEIVY